MCAYMFRINCKANFRLVLTYYTIHLIQFTIDLLHELRPPIRFVLVKGKTNISHVYNTMIDRLFRILPSIVFKA